MSLVRLNIKSRIELETRVLAAALKQSFESGDTDGASLAHRQLFGLLKDVGRAPGDIASIRQADGMPSSYSDVSSTEEQMLIDAARATARASSQNSSDAARKSEFEQQKAERSQSANEADGSPNKETEPAASADPPRGFEPASRQQQDPGSLAAKLYTQPLFGSSERKEIEAEPGAPSPEPTFRPGFMRNSTRLQPTVRRTGANFAAVQPDAAAAATDESKAKHSGAEANERAAERQNLTRKMQSSSR